MSNDNNGGDDGDKGYQLSSDGGVLNDGKEALFIFLLPV